MCTGLASQVIYETLQVCHVEIRLFKVSSILTLATHVPICE